MNRHMRKHLQTLAVCAALLPGLLLVLFPMYVTIVNAMKTSQQSGANFFAPPESFYLENFKSVLATNDFFLYVFNTSAILLVTIPIEMLITPIAAYAIQRNYSRRYFQIFYLLVVSGIFVPFQARMVALVQMMSVMNMMNKVGMVFLYLAATAPPAIFLVVAFVKSVSVEIEEAAIIDGCGPMRAYFSVVFPLMKPVLATLIIKDALFLWNDFQLPLIILNRSTRLWTLQLFQYNFKSQYSYDYNLAFASLLMTMLPIMCLYVALQKHIVAGLSAGAVKG